MRLFVRNAVHEVSSSLPLRIRDGRKRLRDRSVAIRYDPKGRRAAPNHIAYRIKR
ncbi:hypothetical protein [Sphingobacterium sp. FBM7-1]|uniref:hypothetical protein n=1 Tax=Sphingobacterium sp. FBM7-1 TaxID=2886688 RepID=UPI001D127D23|nr:hypothetical protein [Sphingobacterium sp. FBM7-1]MCC2598105.1 hypothetical protein [Sphingobacterium sp. FBM7-1]